MTVSNESQNLKKRLQFHSQNQVSRTRPSKTSQKPSHLALGTPLALFGKGLGGSWTHLGLSWVTVGSSWVLLGASWVPHGRLLGVPGALLAISGPPLGPLESLLGDLGFIFKGFRKGLGGVGGKSGPQNNCSFVFPITSPLNIKIQLSASPKMQDNEFPSLRPPIGLGGIREA